MSFVLMSTIRFYTHAYYGTLRRVRIVSLFHWTTNSRNDTHIIYITTKMKGRKGAVCSVKTEKEGCLNVYWVPSYVFLEKNVVWFIWFYYYFLGSVIMCFFLLVFLLLFYLLFVSNFKSAGKCSTENIKDRKKKKIK